MVDMTKAAPISAETWFTIIAGLSGSLVAIGLARFAYTPLIPPLIQAHWFSASDTVTLGAANFTGYLVGALLGRPLAARFGNRLTLRLMMVAATAAFFACAWPLSVDWYFGWRFASGVAGGVIMVLVATTILPHVPAARRGLASGMIFVGIGMGVAASGTLVPALLQLGLRATWIGLGAVSLVLTAVSWFGWPSTNPQTEAAPADAHHENRRARRTLWVLYGEYAANALGLVPVMVLLVDYIARGLGLGASVGSAYWILYGLAAIVGPLVGGYLADRIGFGATYRLALGAQAASVGILMLSSNHLVIGLAVAVLGALTAGIVPIVVGRIHELIPHSHAGQRAAWSRATTAFALFQALSGYGYSYLFTRSGEDYALIFLCGAVALLAALAADIAVNLGTRRA